MERLIRMLYRGSDAAVRATRRGLYEEAEIIMGKAVRQVPFQYGTLAGSGRVHEPIVQGRDILVELSFGGPAADRKPLEKGGTGGPVQVGYAWIQHERLDFKHAAGRKAKYLEDPVLEARKTLDAKLAKRVHAIIEGIV